MDSPVVRRHYPREKQTDEPHRPMVSGFIHSVEKLMPNLAAVVRLRPALMWVAALNFPQALSVVSSPRPDAPPPALLAPT